jgi:type VI protein secretion system component VasF
VLLQEAERQLSPSHGRTWELAKYALVSWIDESVRNMDGWSGREYWMSNPFEWKHFKSGDSHQYFFVNAREAENSANGDDAFETYYICGMLGFRGFYGRNAPADPEYVKLTVEKYGLPATFNKWARHAGRTLKERRKLTRVATSAEPRERRIKTAKPLWSRMRLVWPWLLAALSAALLAVVVYYGK